MGAKEIRALIKNALADSEEPVTRAVSPDVIKIDSDQKWAINERARMVESEEIELGDSIIFSPLGGGFQVKFVKSLSPFETKVYRHDEVMKDSKHLRKDKVEILDPGQRLQIVTEQGEAFYQVTDTGLAREYIRPQLWLVRGNEDFEVTIENGRTGDGIWICDSQQLGEKMTIKKSNGLVTINGDDSYGEITLGQEHLFIEKTDTGWELINEAVNEAREAEAAEVTPAPETAGKTQWNINASEFLKGVGKEAGVFFNVFKPRDWRDLFALTARGLSEIGGPVGATARAVLLLSNFASIGLKEHLTIKQIRARIEADINNGSLSKKEKKTLARKAYWQQTILGKLLSENDQSNLYKAEELMAISVGVIAALGGMSVGKLAASMLPGSSVQEILLNRGLFSYIMPRLISYIGRTSYELIWSLSGFEYKTSKEADAKEFVEMSLGAMSATITTLVTAGFIWDVGGELLSKLPQFVATAQARATETISSTEKAAATVTVVVTATATSIPPTPTETQAPTETAVPTLEDLWQPGEPINDALLDQAEAAGHLLDTSQGIHINLFGNNLELFRFDLDQKADDHVPEVWAVKNDEGNWVPVIWEDKAGQFAVDITGDGLPEGWLPESDLPRELLPDGRGGGGEAPRLDLALRDYDLDNNGTQDIIPQINQETGKEEFWIDRDGKGTINPGDEKVLISWTKNTAGVNIVDNIEFEDKSYWQLVDKENEEYEGYVLKNRHYVKLTLNEAVGGETAARQKVLIDQYHQLYSPEQIGRQAWLHPESVTMPTPVSVAAPEPVPVPETDTSEEHGEPVPLEEDKPLVQSNGHPLVLGPDGGEQGMLQQEIHVNNPDLDPDALGVVAHRVALTNDPSVSMINQQTAIVSVERWLESNQGWLANNGHPWETLSQGERYEIAKIFVNTYHPVTEPTTFVTGMAGIDFLIHYLGGTFDDDDDMKSSILSIIEQVEADPTRND